MWLTQLFKKCHSKWNYSDFKCYFRINGSFNTIHDKMLSTENTYINTIGGESLSKSRSISPALSTKSMDLLPVVESKRKFSFPVNLHSSSLLGDVNTLSARRRFSNVSDVVTRKLSSTIGWKLPAAVPTQDLVTQGKCLCGQYVRNRLKRSGLFTKKLGLQRLRSIIGTPSAHIVREVFPALNYVRFCFIFFLRCVCVWQCLRT